MRNRSIWTSTVNFYVSIIFMAMFGLATTSFLLRFAELDDPVTGILTSSIEAVED